MDNIGSVYVDRKSKVIELSVHDNKKSLLTRREAMALSDMLKAEAKKMKEEPPSPEHERVRRPLEEPKPRKVRRRAKPS